MSTLTQVASKKAALEKLQKELQELEQSEAYKKEKKFLDELDKLLEKHGKSKLNLYSALQEELGGSGAGRSGDKRKPRALVRYTNPHTKETVEARSGNQSTVKAWVEKYGKEKVAKWKEVIG